MHSLAVVFRYELTKMTGLFYISRSSEISLVRVSAALSSNASSHCVLIFHVLLQLHSIFLHNNRRSVQTTGNQSFSRPKVKKKDKTRKKLMTTCIKYLNEML
jgi:uncharacterized membrane protein